MSNNFHQNLCFSCQKILTPPGKPSTWFPGEGLVTQAQMFYLLSNMFIQKSVCVINALYMSFHIIFEVFKFDSNLFIFEMFSHHKFTINIYHLFEHLHEICSWILCFNIVWCHKTLQITFHIIFEIFKIWPWICSFYEISLGMNFFRRLTVSFENLHEICQNISN